MDEYPADWVHLDVVMDLLKVSRATVFALAKRDKWRSTRDRMSQTVYAIEDVRATERRRRAPR